MQKNPAGYICYFFLTNRAAKKEVSIKYCPTGDMVSDFVTKLLQSSAFKKFCNQILNIDDPSNSVTCNLWPQECVGKL